MSPEKLASMANQIGRSFAHRGEEQAVLAIADHLRKFWNPGMRIALRNAVELGSVSLDPSVLRAVMSGTRTEPGYRS
jgi:formate dehydrogenase subunit delta